MKIQLNYKIDIDIKEGNKTKQKLSIFYREFTKEEKKKQKQLEKKFFDIFKQAQKIEKRQAILDKKAELYELNGEYDKSIKAIEEKEKLDKKADELFDELEELGGEDQDSFMEELAKSRFDMLVSGEDKDKLESIAESIGYATLMTKLDKAKAELEKKQSGE